MTGEVCCECSCEVVVIFVCIEVCDIPAVFLDNGGREGVLALGTFCDELPGGVFAVVVFASFLSVVCVAVLLDIGTGLAATPRPAFCV